MLVESLREFLYESNLIEGIDLPDGILEDYWDNPDGEVISLTERHARNSCKALQQAMFIYMLPLTPALICQLHFTQMEGLLEPKYCGKLRDIGVRVGGDICPDPKKVPKLLEQYVKLYNQKTWEPNRLHFEFETIHPFVDGNGRTGRLIYAMDLLRRSKAITSILTEFGNRFDSFNSKRASYYAAIAYHKAVLKSLRYGI